MSIFTSIKNAIFGGPAEAAEMPGAAPAGGPAKSAAIAGAASPAVASAPGAQVDVAAMMDKWSETAEDDDLDWRKSIVDLMKILKLDSSLKARKALATELHYTGDMGDSATMNVWLHKQVMTKLAETGGKVPADLKHS